MTCIFLLTNFFLDAMVLSSVFYSFREFENIFERFEFTQSSAFVSNFLEDAFARKVFKKEFKNISIYRKAPKSGENASQDQTEINVQKWDKIVRISDIPLLIKTILYKKILTPYCILNSLA